MSVTVNEHWEGRKSSETEDVRTYTRAFIAVTSNAAIGSKEVREAVGIDIGDEYDTSPDSDLDEEAFCTSVSPQQDAEDPRKWMVTVEYSTDSTSSLEVSWDVVKKKVALEVDRFGEAILNSAGDTFDPPIDTEQVQWRLTINKWKSSFNPVTLSDYLFHTNISTFYGFAAGQVLLDAVRAKQSRRGGVDGWDTTWEFLCDVDGHDLHLLDMGMRELGLTAPNHIIDSRGQLVSKPVLLDGTGFPLADPTPATAEFLDFEIYDQANFDDLGLT